MAPSLSRSGKRRRRKQRTAEGTKNSGRSRRESTCKTEIARGTHALRIFGYSMQRGVIDRDKFIRSANFAVGGYDWAVRFYPNGVTSSDDGYVSVFLELRSKDTEVRALYEFRLVDQDTGISSLIHSENTVAVFRSGVSDNPAWGTAKLVKASVLEGSAYLRQDCLVIECDVTVIKELQMVGTTTSVEVDVPPPDLLDNLGKLLESEDVADVTVKVKGEVFHAHKVVLAMRSPVFKAELYGPMRNKNTMSICVKDMEPYVFKALLHFIYKDSLPAMDDLSEDDKQEMVKHLLAAADRYGMERMKLICESILCNKIDVESVAATLVLADQFHCCKLKDACIGFINSSNRLNDVLASQGYAHLESACPAVFMDILEKAAKSSKI